MISNNDLQKLKEWASDKEFTLPNGQILLASDFINKKIFDHHDWFTSWLIDRLQLSKLLNPNFLIIYPDILIDFGFRFSSSFNGFRYNFKNGYVIARLLPKNEWMFQIFDSEHNILGTIYLQKINVFNKFFKFLKEWLR